MKTTTPFFFLLTLLVFTSSCNPKKPAAEKEEISQKAVSPIGFNNPGSIPQLFAPGLVSTDALEVEPAFSADMKEFYFLRQKDGERSKNFVIKYEDGKWSEPIERSSSEGEVFISVDNQRMYLGSKYRERLDTAWSEEKSLGAEFEKYPIMRLTASSDDTYFFDERDTIGTLRYTRIVDGKRETPQPLGDQFHKGIFISHPFIAPDKSYLIWDCEREDSYGGSDLYISFRQEDNSWGPAINMGDKINTEADDFYGSITTDGQYFYFSRIKLGKTFEESHADVYWVDAEVVMRLKDGQ